MMLDEKLMSGGNGPYTKAGDFKSTDLGNDLLTAFYSGWMPGRPRRHSSGPSVAAGFAARSHPSLQARAMSPTILGYSVDRPELTSIVPEIRSQP